MVLAALAVCLGDSLCGARPKLRQDAKLRAQKDCELHAKQGQQFKADFRFREALKEFEQGETTARIGYGEPSMWLAYFCSEQAKIHRLFGDYNEAIKLFLRTQENYAKTTEENRAPEEGAALANLAYVYQILGSFKQAETYYEQSQKLVPRGSLDEAGLLSNHAMLKVAMKQFDRAEELFERSLAIYQNQKETPRIRLERAVVHSNLGWVQQANEHYKQAIELYLRSEQVLSHNDQGRKGPYLARLWSNLGWLHHARSEAGLAENYGTKALKVRQDELPPNHPDTAMSHDNLSGLYASQGQWEKAVEHADQGRRILGKHTMQVLVGLSEFEQLDFLKTRYRPEWHGALSLGLKRKEDQATVDRSAEWVCNGKALIHEVLAARLLQARDEKNPVETNEKLRQLIKQLREVQQELAAMNAVPQGKEGEFAKKLTTLSRKEQELTQQIVKLGGHQLPGKDWVELKHVRQTLPENAVLIDIVRFGVWDFKVKGTERSWQPDRYAAWIIPPMGKEQVHLVDLGEARVIDAAIKDVRTVVKKLETDKEDIADQKASEQELRKPLKALSQLVLLPLQKHIGGVRKWIISPDQELWLIPWAALPLANDKYTVEQHTLSFVVSARDLVHPPQPRSRGAKPAPAGLVMGNPNFDLGADELRTLTRAFPRHLQFRGTRSQISKLFSSVESLPQTELEARMVTRTLEKFLGEKPEVRLDNQAVASYLRAVHHPRVIWLGTHGFFIEVKEDDTRRLRDVELLNPLRRCGLVFAGFNHLRGKAGDDSDDGMLTGEDVLEMHLGGTELVVLSACRTARGDVRQGEGVAGLHQAFQLAGAQSVLATLWNVQDRETSDLIQTYFEHLARNKSRDDALHEAQVERIEKLRAKHNGVAHPYYWAAFTLTGPDLAHSSGPERKGRRSLDDPGLQ
jgi:CHAT domain-containing protein